MSVTYDLKTMDASITSNYSHFVEKKSLYNKDNERDSCGIGLASRKIIADANKLLVRLTHRGGRQEEDGDGAGIMIGIPHRFFKKISFTGQLPFSDLPDAGKYGVGMIFLPNGEENEQLRYELMEKIEEVVKQFGLSLLGWRSPLPVKSSNLGLAGKITEPYIVQIFVCFPQDNRNNVKNDNFDPEYNDDPFFNDNFYDLEPLDSGIYDLQSSFSSFPSENYKNTTLSSDKIPLELEKLLYLVRRKLAIYNQMYIVSFSSRSIVYKGQFHTAQLFSYYDDLLDEDFTSYFAIVHARFSTNTFPTWDRAHPFRKIAHNGEINTIGSNRRWLKAKEGVLERPHCLGIDSSLEEIIPVEEPAYITRFCTPKTFNKFPDVKEPIKDIDTAGVSTDGKTHRGSFLGAPTSFISSKAISHTSSRCSYDQSDSNDEYSDSTDTNDILSSSNLSHKGKVDKTTPSGDKIDTDINSDKNEKNYSSDSASLDNIIEMLTMGGRDIAEAVMMVIPESFRKNEEKWKIDYFKFLLCVMEPWDGPSAVIFTDGVQLGAQLDRNGLRPGRFVLTKDDRLIISSETGVVDVHPELIIKKGRLRSGKMILVNYNQSRIYHDEEIKKYYANKKPYSKWIEQYAINLDDYSIFLNDNELRRDLQLPYFSQSDNETKSYLSYKDDIPCNQLNRTKRDSVDTIDKNLLKKKTLTTYDGSHDIDKYYLIQDIKSQLTMFGYHFEKFASLISPMAKYGVEALGSMGYDSPLSCLSTLPKVPGDYFQQTFAQGTNPPIDCIRESNVMSLFSVIGPQRDMFTVTKKHVNRVFLETPVLNPSDFHSLVTLPGFPCKTIDLSAPVGEFEFNLEKEIKRILDETEAAINSGYRTILLSDRLSGQNRYPVWSTLATGAVHLHLLKIGIRGKCALIVESGEASEVHYIALLLSCGADAIYPYLIYKGLFLIPLDKDENPLPISRLIENFISACNLGLLRIMSKVGITTVPSYKGGFFFQSVGLSTSVLDLCFDSEPSPIEGIDFKYLSYDTVRFHLLAYPTKPHPSLYLSDNSLKELTDRENLFLSMKQKEPRAYHPDTIKFLQDAVKTNSEFLYKKYAAIQDTLIDKISLRGQLDLCYCSEGPLSLADVESASEIVKRLVTSALSFGSLSQDVLETLSLAMNSIGSRSNCGEGGEPAPSQGKSKKLYRSKTKQVGSARFGVTAFYLSSASEIQIKCGQGANAGEGEELASDKVTSQIASVRRSTMGIGLISPAPHHDMYSIEDSAQLIMDLKHANPRARISVKLVSKLGIGVIAAGFVKAKADHIVISGFSGGTGAGKLSSIEHTALPWEIGLAEVHQTLCLNGLREKVILQVDGQLKTGRDVIYAALLGAEEFGFGTQPLIALGCDMTRNCHLNTCSKGIATQDPELRKLFQGKAEYVINYFFMLAEEIRGYMAKLGITKFSDLIGRSDLLKPKENLKDNRKYSLFDFTKLLNPGWVLSSPLDAFKIKCETLQPRPIFHTTAHDHELDRSLDTEIIRRARKSLISKEQTQFYLPIRNVDRAVGGLLSHEVTIRYKEKGLPDNSIIVKFKGSAGQSFGCWLPKGVTFELTGDANDFVGKGLSGGTVIVRPPFKSPFFKESNKNIILGNSVLYGATSGTGYFAGIAGERFAVRNSGCIAVVEGCGDYGCEYMTRGIVVVLGETGKNFATGMSGGVAYVLDLNKHQVNSHMFDLKPLLPMKTFPQTASDLDDLVNSNKECSELKQILKRHYQATHSTLCDIILQNYSSYVLRFTKIVPKEITNVLKQAIIKYLTTGDTEAEALLDDWDTVTSFFRNKKLINFNLFPSSLHHFIKEFQKRKTQLQNLKKLNIHESALSILNISEKTTVVEKYISEIVLTDEKVSILDEENIFHFSNIMRIIRGIHSQVYSRSGLTTDISDKDYNLIKALLPDKLSLDNRRTITQFLLGNLGKTENKGEKYNWMKSDDNHNNPDFNRNPRVYFKGTDYKSTDNIHCHLEKEEITPIEDIVIEPSFKPSRINKLVGFE